MQQIALLLMQEHAAREVATCLSLPLTTIYRWQSGCHSQLDATPTDTPRIENLVHACERHGFMVRESVATLVSAPLGAPAIRSFPTTKCANDLPESPARGSSAEGDSRRKASGRDVIGSSGLRRKLSCAYEALTHRYYEKWSTSRLALHAEVSKWHFIRAFKLQFGITPHQLLTATRIKHARALLERTPHSLEMVARAVGFDSASTLCKAFRSSEGSTLSSVTRGMRLGGVIPVAAPGPNRARIGTRAP